MNLLLPQASDHGAVTAREECVLSSVSAPDSSHALVSHRTSRLGSGRSQPRPSTHSTRRRAACTPSIVGRPQGRHLCDLYGCQLMTQQHKLVVLSGCVSFRLCDSMTVICIFIWWSNWTIDRMNHWQSIPSIRTWHINIYWWISCSTCIYLSIRGENFEQHDFG